MNALDRPSPDLSLGARIERALVVLAYFMELDGDVHLALYEKLEAELEALKRQQDARERARHRLSAYAPVEALRAIR